MKAAPECCLPNGHGTHQCRYTESWDAVVSKQNPVQSEIILFTRILPTQSATALSLTPQLTVMVERYDVACEFHRLRNVSRESCHLPRHLAAQ
jgi:hypothetical protein